MHYYTRDEPTLLEISRDPALIDPTRLERFVDLSTRLKLEVLQDVEMPNVAERLMLLDGWAEDFYRTIVRL